MQSYEARNACDNTISAVESTLKNIKQLESNKKSLRFFLGFDGYIDTIYQMVRNRKSATEVEFYNSMAEFGQKIVETAGSSASIERILKKKIGGGFAPNTARAIANMSPRSQLNLYGTLGYPEMDPIYKELPKNIQLHSVGNMGLTLAMEFNDGKIMSQDMEGIITLTWEKLIERIGRENLITAFENADAIGNGHWSLMLQMNNYWDHFITDIFPNVKDISKKIFFVDPADLAKRTTEDIRTMLFLLKKMNEQIPVLLTVNDREAIDVARVLSREGVEPLEKHNFGSYENAGKNINKILNLDYMVIHEPHFATISGSTKKGNFHHWITEGYTSKPKFTTAAGDHFNGGAIIALLSDMTPTEALIVANAATAIFVRTGKSPSIATIRQFIENYFNFIQEDIDTFCFDN